MNPISPPSLTPAPQRIQIQSQLYKNVCRRVRGGKRSKEKKTHKLCLLDRLGLYLTVSQAFLPTVAMAMEIAVDFSDSPHLSLGQ